MGCGIGELAVLIALAFVVADLVSVALCLHAALRWARTPTGAALPLAAFVVGATPLVCLGLIVGRVVLAGDIEPFDPGPVGIVLVGGAVVIPSMIAVSVRALCRGALDGIDSYVVPVLFVAWPCGVTNWLLVASLAFGPG